MKLHILCCFSLNPFGNMSSKEKNFKIDPTCKIRHESKEYSFTDLVGYFLKLHDGNSIKWGACSYLNDSHVVCIIFLLSFLLWSHRIYRRVVNKVKRKFKRQTEAGLSANTCTRGADGHEIVEDEDEATKAKMHLLWLEREKLAQIEWRTKKELESRKKVHRLIVHVVNRKSFFYSDIKLYHFI